ncbi:unnamed protein product [Didymodactylos carnosus]|uniref:Transmembrane protein 144 n=1 Tax=Didymodactylos carnosus TaxID=1234261 RepID=A0A813YLR9_9BILA|nr:unnamed protein product [Didymodactylos carnosus]CAF3671155.1 unnamed protein product [Didymodactylos carnosus]
MDLLQIAITNITTTTPYLPVHTPLYLGYIAVIAAVLLFGSNLVPANKFPVGDGLAFQFFMCIGIWCTGWASGHFGWFGLISEKVEHPIMNYFGVACGCLSALMFINIRAIKTDALVVPERRPLLSHENIVHDTPSDLETQVNINAVRSTEAPVVEVINVNPTPPPTLKIRLIAYILAIICGSLFGLIFTPSTYIQDHPEKYPNASKNGLHYAFSMYSGILLTSSVFFFVYTIVKRNRPQIYAESICPALVSGILWGIAQAAFLISNSILSQAITFPLVVIGVGSVATLWSIFYFKEIFGMRNYLFVFLGMCLSITASVLIVLSKPKQ